MGRLPGQNATKMDKDGYLSVGEEEMLKALESTLKAVEEGNIIIDEYSFTFTTAKVYKRAGGLERMPGRHQSYWAELSVQMFAEVKKAFEAVENGSLKEEGYYFELTTPYFHFTSGYYPPRDKDEKETEPWSPWDYFPVLDSILEKPQSLIKKLSMLLEVESVGPPGLKKKKNGQRNIPHIRITVRFILVASVLMAHAEALPVAKEEQPVTLTAGTNGIVPFECSNEHQSASKYTTVKFEGKGRPFYINGMLDPEGLMSRDQAERFRVEYHEEGSTMSIEISIASVSVEDQGTYVVMVIVQLGETHESYLMKRVVVIFIPPAPVICFPEKSSLLPDYFEIHCHSRPGTGNATISCFQNDEKLPFLRDQGDTQQTALRGIFWLMKTDSPVSCCAHDVKQQNTIKQDFCNQFRYPRIEPVDSHVSPHLKAPTEIARTTKPLHIEEENRQATIQNTSNSGFTQNFQWPTLLLPVMTVMTLMCISNP